MHGESLVHGDVKGSNILLDERAEVKIADFGLARHRDTTRTENAMVSWHFAAPELFADENEYDEEKVDTYRFSTWTDVYSFACLYYEVRRQLNLWLPVPIRCIC